MQSGRREGLLCFCIRHRIPRETVEVRRYSVQLVYVRLIVREKIRVSVQVNKKYAVMFGS
jgi:hypothetical protein